MLGLETVISWGLLGWMMGVLILCLLHSARACADSHCLRRRVTGESSCRFDREELWFRSGQDALLLGGLMYGDYKHHPPGRNGSCDGMDVEVGSGRTFVRFLILKRSQIIQTGRWLSQSDEGMAPPFLTGVDRPFLFFCDRNQAIPRGIITSQAS